MRSFKPVKILAITGVKERTVYLNNYAMATAWEKVLDMYLGINDSTVRTKVASHYSGRTTVKGQWIYHKSMGEVVEKYHDAFNAVLITHDSWIDKKLQETYNSKRTVAKGNDSDGSDTT